MRSITLLALAALALAVGCDDLPRPTITDGRGNLPMPKDEEPSPKGSEPTSITLTYAWPEAVRANVRYTKSSVVMDEKSPDESFGYAFDAKRHSKGHTVGASGPSDGPVSVEELAARGEVLAASNVDEKGAFLGVADAANVHRDGLEAMRARYEKEGSLSFFESSVRDSLSPGLIEDRSKTLWEFIVGHWAGRTLERGTPVEITIRSPMGAASIGQGPLELQAQLLYVGPTRCAPDEVELDCVALSLKASVDPEVLKKNIREGFRSSLPPDAPLKASADAGIEVERALATREIQLVTDPKTLLPRRATIKQGVDLVVKTRHSESEPPARQETRANQRIERIFTYE